MSLRNSQIKVNGVKRTITSLRYSSVTEEDVEHVVVPGNPGVCELYTGFARRLRDKSNTPVTVHGYASFTTAVVKYT